MKINDINHVAIIMDGNGRWAEQHNLPRFSGHKKGLDKIPEVVRELINNKIKYITLFPFQQKIISAHKKKKKIYLIYLNLH